MPISTVLAQATANTCREAGERLRRGELVAFPTETVYGLGGNATDSHAVAAIFEAKGRPSFNPLIVHVADPIAAEAYVEFTEHARDLAHAFWPGPLTLVLPKRASGGLSDLISAGLDTVAIRVPGHPVALDILKAAGCPIAAPSANLSGRISPTCAAHVVDGLNRRVHMIVDGGPCAVGLESTVLSLIDDRPIILRPGAVTAEQISACLGLPVEQAVNLSPSVDEETPLHSPGMLSSHYAPDALMRLNATDVRDGEVLLGFGEVQDAVLNLSPSGDLKEAAVNMFAMLRLLDSRGVGTIAVSPIPDQGLGCAINDRLRRAAAPRP
jgi:L-threonylcarbamoyladenylate synthase